MSMGLMELLIIVCGAVVLLVSVIAGLYFWQQRER